MAIATTSGENQKAAQLAWDRRQKTNIAQKSGGAATGFSNPRGGDNQMSSRNLLALAKNSDRNSPLGERVRGEVGKQVGGAVGGYLGSVAPGVGTAIGKKGGEIVGKAIGKSKVGKWISIALLAWAFFFTFMLFVITIGTLQSICTSNTAISAASTGSWVGQLVGYLVSPIVPGAQIAGSIAGGTGAAVVHGKTVGSFCSAFQ